MGGEGRRIVVRELDQRGHALVDRIAGLRVPFAAVIDRTQRRIEIVPHSSERQTLQRAPANLVANIEIEIAQAIGGRDQELVGTAVESVERRQWRLQGGAGVALEP